MSDVMSRAEIVTLVVCCVVSAFTAFLIGFVLGEMRAHRNAMRRLRVLAAREPSGESES